MLSSLVKKRGEKTCKDVHCYEYKTVLHKIVLHKIVWHKVVLNKTVLNKSGLHKPTQSENLMNFPLIPFDLLKNSFTCIRKVHLTSNAIHIRSHRRALIPQTRSHYTRLSTFVKPVPIDKVQIYIKYQLAGNFIEKFTLDISVCNSWIQLKIWIIHFFMEICEEKRPDNRNPQNPHLYNPHPYNPHPYNPHPYNTHPYSFHPNYPHHFYQILTISITLIKSLLFPPLLPRNNTEDEDSPTPQMMLPSTAKRVALKVATQTLPKSLTFPANINYQHF